MRTTHLLFVLALIPLTGCIGWTNLPAKRVNELATWDPEEVTEERVAYQVHVNLDSWIMPDDEAVTEQILEILQCQFPNGRLILHKEGDDPARWAGDHRFALHVEVSLGKDYHWTSRIGPGVGLLLIALSFEMVRSGGPYGIIVFPFALGGALGITAALMTAMPYLALYEVQCKTTIFDRHGVPRLELPEPSLADGRLLIHAPTIFVAIESDACEVLPRFALRDQLQRLEAHPIWSQLEVEPLVFGAPQVATVVPRGDRSQWYSFELGSFDRIELAFEAKRGAEVGVELAGPEGESLARSNSGLLEFEAAAPGRYFVRLINPEAKKADGVVRSKLIPCEDDSHEGNDVQAEAVALAPSTTELICLDDDWFAVALEAGQELNTQVDFDTELADLDLALHAADGSPLGASEGSGPVEAIAYRATKPETVYLRIRALTLRRPCPYTLTIAQN